MEKERKALLYSLMVAVVVFGLTVICWLKPADEFSATERRKLEQFPEISVASIFNGNFMEKFETYTLDQFPLRDEFRSIKAAFHKYAFGQMDNNGIYIADGSVSEMDAEISETALQRAKNKFTSIYNAYIAGSDAKVYMSVIPDKNYFLAEENGYLAYDYEELYAYVQENLDFAEYIEIRDLLEIEDYYRTDTHWKQENIVDVAQRLGDKMGTQLMASYEQKTVANPFYGVYYGQLALPIEPDTVTYLDTDVFKDCVIYDHENQKNIPMYDLELAAGRDAYEMFLSGSLSVITIENPNATTEKELVIFRDSFGSSLSPLLVEGYQKITVLDVRYLNEKMIGNFVEFSNQDVLFIYSTSVLNNESSFR